MKNYDVKNIRLAESGKSKIEWAGEHMAVLALIKKRFAEEKPLEGVRLGACLHVTAETANLILVLKAGGAVISLCASNPLSTQDEVAASLVSDFKIPVFAIKGEDNKTYYEHINGVLDICPNITMDDGADLVSQIHKLFEITARDNRYYCRKNETEKSWELYGSSEETTTGVIRLRAMAKDKALKLPVIAVNDSRTKHFFDNRYGTGQSTLDGILRSTNLLLAGKKIVVCGYGWCGRGIASRANGAGAIVIVTEIDPVKALEAVMDGYEVLPIAKAAKIADLFITATGDKNVITVDHMKAMKDGAILANSGHFNVEVAVADLEKAAASKRKIREYVTEYRLGNKKIYILGEGRLINLVAAEGHPAEVMDMSFANQALAAEWMIKNRGKLKPAVYTLPDELDEKIAGLKLKSMGVEIDRLTSEQKAYLASWKEGT
ncbi:MAG: adenosylhomocysteinase [bacterium]|nr:adenosylhomocysteinase [bacterium]